MEILFAVSVRKLRSFEKLPASPWELMAIREADGRIRGVLVRRPAVGEEDVDRDVDWDCAESGEEEVGVAKEEADTGVDASENVAGGGILVGFKVTMEAKS